jgi:hypothetical protein
MESSPLFCESAAADQERQNQQPAQVTHLIFTSHFEANHVKIWFQRFIDGEMVRKVPRPLTNKTGVDI